MARIRYIFRLRRRNEPIDNSPNEQQFPNRRRSGGCTIYHPKERIMSVHKGKTRRFAMTLALAAGLSSLPALAQPGHHGMHDGSPLAHAILSLKTQLNLTT